VVLKLHKLASINGNTVRVGGHVVLFPEFLGILMEKFSGLLSKNEKSQEIFLHPHSKSNSKHPR